MRPISALADRLSRPRGPGRAGGGGALQRPTRPTASANTAHRRVVPLAIAVALVVPFGTGCSGAQAPEQTPTSTTTAGADAPITVNTRAIAGSMLPANASDPATVRLTGLLFRGLVRYDQKGKAQMEVAESVTSTDDQVYRVTLAPGWTFSDGSPITAHSFVDAWNLTARPSSHMYRADALSPIAGYDAMRSPARSQPSAGTRSPGAAPSSGPSASAGTSAGSPSRPTTPPAALAGLDVLDDRTFTITLTDPDPTFVERLGDPAFAPLPPSALADPAAFAADPVGNGPYRLAGIRRPDGATASPARTARGDEGTPAGSLVSLRPNALA